MKTNLVGDTRQKLVQTATHAMKTNVMATHAMNTKLEETHAMKTNLEGDIRHENKLKRRHMP